MAFLKLIPWRILLGVAIVAGSFVVGHISGIRTVKAGMVDSAVAALRQAAGEINRVQPIVDRLGDIETGLARSAGNVASLAPEIKRSLKDANVLANCPPFTAADVRGLSGALDRLETEARMAPGRADAERP